jgi:ribonuclease BN (tRNA processing enzyme)
MKIVFLGTGGGRVNLVEQRRWTGGFRIIGPPILHIDPGPGALVRTIACGLNPRDLDAVIVSHLHVDHSSDGNVMVEAMSGSGPKKRGIIIGSHNAVLGNYRHDRGFSSFHLEKAETIWAPGWGESRNFQTARGEFSLKAVKAVHEEKSCIGMIISIGGKAIGYTSDTEYYDGIGAAYAGCDMLIANAMKPGKDEYGGHLSSAEAAKLIAEAKPKLAVLTHMGMKMLSADPEKEAAAIEKTSGVKTIAAKDGMELEL